MNGQHIQSVLSTCLSSITIEPAMKTQTTPSSVEKGVLWSLSVVMKLVKRMTKEVWKIAPSAKRTIGARQKQSHRSV